MGVDRRELEPQILATPVQPPDLHFVDVDVVIGRRAFQHEMAIDGQTNTAVDIGLDIAVAGRGGFGHGLVQAQARAVRNFEIDTRLHGWFVVLGDRRRPATCWPGRSQYTSIRREGKFPPGPLPKRLSCGENVDKPVGMIELIGIKTMKDLAPLFASTPAGSALTGLDWLMIALYFSILLGVAWWVIRKSKDTAADYFLAGRNLGWWVVGASIFASNIGSEHVVGLAGSGATDGVAMAHFELHAWCLLVLAWVFVPFYARSMVFTMPEFLERRFSPASRYVLSIVSLVTFIVSKIAVGIFAGGVVFRTLLPEIHLSRRRDSRSTAFGSARCSCSC